MCTPALIMMVMIKQGQGRHVASVGCSGGFYMNDPSHVRQLRIWALLALMGFSVGGHFPSLFVLHVCCSLRFTSYKCPFCDEEMKKNQLDGDNFYTVELKYKTGFTPYCTTKVYEFISEG